MAAQKKYPEGAKRSSFFFPPDLKERLTAHAKDTDRSETQVVHDALEHEFAGCSEAKPTDKQAFG